MPKVEEIKNDAFARTRNLESITISDTADTIASQAFYSELYASHDVNYTDVNCIENPSTTNTCEQVKALMKQARAPLKDDAFYIITEPTENCSGYSQGVCSTCKSGYHPADNSCVANPPNCKVFAGNACSECATGYLTKESGCVEPSSCTGEYLISGNECIKMLGCVDYANGACQVCETGYYKKENGCVVATEGCGDGYLEKNSVCISAAQGCGVGYKDMGGWCNRIRYTPAEAAKVLRDDNTNEVTITFKK